MIFDLFHGTDVVLLVYPPADCFLTVDPSWFSTEIAGALTQ
jgi:hypothetical protein